MIHNKSNHPVEIKKIAVRIWALRDEIEFALEQRKLQCEAQGVDLYVEDIRQFYQLATNITLRTPQGSENKDNVISLEGANQTEKNDEGQKSTDQNLAQADDQQNTLNIPDFIKTNPFQRPSLPKNKISLGFVFLSDIHMKNVLVFTQKSFLQGQCVSLEFLVPQSFILTANVSYCHHYGLRSRIISDHKPEFRLQCTFSFTFKKERSNLRDFVTSIEPSILQETKNLLDNVSEDDSLEA